MAVSVNLAGATLIKVSQPGIDLGNGSGELINLGYSRNGVTVSYEGYFLDVPSDEHGGDDGPPIDIQWLGEIARIRCELTKFDKAVFKTLAARVAGEVWGLPSSDRIGQLMFSGAKTTRVALANDSDSRNFPRCIIRAAIDMNYATKYSAPIIEFEAHRDGSGTLHDATVA